MEKVRVRVFASHPLAVAQFEGVLSAESDFSVVSSADGFQVAVFDGTLPALLALVASVRSRSPGVRPLLVTPLHGDDDCLLWVAHGIYGAVPYDRWRDDLCRAVRQVATGQFWFPPRVVFQFIRLQSRALNRKRGRNLTQRETDILPLLSAGFSNKEIGGALKIRERTVKFHVSNIFRKLKVTSRREFALVSGR